MLNQLSPRKRDFVKRYSTAIVAGREVKPTEIAREMGVKEESAASMASQWLRDEKVLYSVLGAITEEGKKRASKDGKLTLQGKATDEKILDLIWHLARYAKSEAVRLAAATQCGKHKDIGMWKEQEVVKDVDATKERAELRSAIEGLAAELRQSPQAAIARSKAIVEQITGSQGAQSDRLCGANADAIIIPHGSRPDQDSERGEQRGQDSDRRDRESAGADGGTPAPSDG